MVCRDLGSRGALVGAAFAGAAVAVMLAPATPAVANETCQVGMPGIAVCGAAPDLARDLSRRRVGRTLATDPAAERLGRLAAPNTGSTPFSMSAGGGNATDFNTSLNQWGSALSAADAQALKDAKLTLDEDIPLPKLPKAQPSKFDLWAAGRREAFTEDGAVSKKSSAFTTYLGADYRASRDFLFGGMVQLDDSRQSIIAAPEAIDGKAFMAGPYMAYRLTPHVTLDAKAGWGSADDSAVAEHGNARFTSERMQSEAKLSGNWGFDRWQLSQSGAVTYLGEQSDAAGSSVDVTRLSVGPELKRQFDTKSGASVEPFAFFKSSLDLNDASVAEPVSRNTLGAGVSLIKPENFDIRATADYTESTSGASGVNEPVATGKVQVKVPSNVLGF
jgi:hypothetical protein